MAEKQELLSSGKLAQALGASPAAVKKLIGELKIEPTAVKGNCSYYDGAAMTKLKAALKK